MESLLSQNSPPMPSDREMVIQELINGQDLTTQLRILLSDNRGLGEAGVLVEKITKSFVEAISILKNSGGTQVDFRDFSTAGVSPPCSGDGENKLSGERVKTKHRHGATERRGSKRRRTSETWTRLSATPFDDGHMWRKYGQKEILGAVYPRCYFRCTHKHDQGCQATKQVQRSEIDSSMFQITYMGQHTCKDLLKPQRIVLDSTTTGSCITNFQSTMLKGHDHLFASSNTRVKREFAEEMPSILTQTSLPSGYLTPFDHITLDSYVPAVNFSMSVSDTGDVDSSVYSSTSSRTLDMDLVNPDDIDSLFCFDEIGFK